MRILVAEDDPDVSAFYKRTLEKRNHDVVLTLSGDACIQNYFDNLPGITTMPSGAATISLIGPFPPRSKINSRRTQIRRATTFSVKSSSYDVVILDYKMEGMNGMDMAEEILKVNPHQRIIFAFAYAKKSLQESVKQLKQTVEFIQKPLKLNQLVDIVEDRQVYAKLKELNVDICRIRDAALSHETLIDLIARLIRIHADNTF